MLLLLDCSIPLTIISFQVTFWVGLLPHYSSVVEVVPSESVPKDGRPTVRNVGPNASIFLSQG